MRRPSLDILRFAAAFGVVCIHAQTSGRDIAFAAVPIFVMLSVSLSVEQGSWRSFYSRRASRLLIPWWFWMVFYGVLGWVFSGCFFGESQTLLEGILRGPRAHLWYMPFIIVVLGALPPVMYLFKCLPSWAATLLALAIGVVLLASLPWLVPLGKDTPPMQAWIAAMPAAFIGLSIGLGCKTESIARRSLVSMAIICLAVSIVSIVIWKIGERSLGVRYIIATCSTCLAYLVYLPESHLARGLSDLSLGTYLLHPAVLWYGLRVDMLAAQPILLASSVFVVSAMLVWALRSFPAGFIRTAGRAIT